jgi:hypothetical protein
MMPLRIIELPAKDQSLPTPPIIESLSRLQLSAFQSLQPFSISLRRSLHMTSLRLLNFLSTNVQLPCLLLTNMLMPSYPPLFALLSFSLQLLRLQSLILGL